MVVIGIHANQSVGRQQQQVFKELPNEWNKAIASSDSPFLQDDHAVFVYVLPLCYDDDSGGARRGGRGCCH